MKPHTSHSSLNAALCVAVGIMLSALDAFAATSIAQHGITWRFDRDYQTGQYANGDYWVVGPVTIIEITPASTTIDGRTINGSMINPKAGIAEAVQGFDSAMYGTYGPYFNHSLNVGRPNGNDLNSSNPLNLAPGTSLISTISHPTPGQRPQLTDGAVLTIVQSAPPANSFRPAYSGDDKTHRWTTANLDFGILQQMPRLPSSPDLTTLASRFARPWIEINTEWLGRFMHPSKNQPDYGRDMAYLLGNGLLALHLDYSNNEKTNLYIYLVQYGIDIYGAILTGATWPDNGGHNLGRKMPLILAGIALSDPGILQYADATKHMIFQEDRQTWVVTQSDVGRILHTADGRKREQYIQQDVGIPEWGEKHFSAPSRDGRNWDITYRDIAGSGFASHALAAHLTPGAVQAWNWSPFFSYVDRFVSIEIHRTTGSNIIPQYHKELWTALRDRAISVQAPLPPTNAKLYIH